MPGVVDGAHNEMGMNVGDGAAREAAVATAGAKPVIRQLIQLPESPGDLPEFSKLLILQIQQVSDMAAGRYQEMQPGSRVREIIVHHNPVLRFDLDGGARRLGAEHAYPRSFEALHLLALLFMPGVAEAVKAQCRLSRSSRKKVYASPAAASCSRSAAVTVNPLSQPCGMRASPSISVCTRVSSITSTRSSSWR